MADEDRALLETAVGRAALAGLGSLPVAALLDAGGPELTRLGLAPPTRRRLLAIAELARRHQPRVEPPAPVLGPRAALAWLGPLRRRPVEVMAVLLLDARRVPIRLEAVAEGAVAHVGVTPREVFAPAVAARASALILAHNHPSGVTEPSAEDRAFTRRMVAAGRLLEIAVVDHLVVAVRGYASFRERGLL